MAYTAKIRVRIHVNGIVQGVGFRPFIYKLAHQYNLYGFVLNNGEGVVIELEGESNSIDSFFKNLHTHLPPLAKIDTLKKETISLKESKTFEILSSQDTAVHTSVPADVSLCKACLEEMHDSTNRRYKYPFINCTDCGPRYTIINTLPYDRAKTSMHGFRMCQKCRDEYEDPNSRRYHAQPISCFECGPKMSLVTYRRRKYHTNVIERTAELLKRGECVAIKGVGGFHLMCDARNEKAVAKLRKDKNRPSKPFAVIFPSLNSAKEEAHINQKEVDLLCSIQKPVVLLEKKRATYTLAPSVAPNVPRIGIFLPYTPVHELLLEILQIPLVATSANRSGEPIITDEIELFQKLSSVVNRALTNNRKIVHSCDDSISAVLQEQTIFHRLARGYAPLHIYLKNKTYKSILALGAQQKSTITIAFENTMVHSVHLGDLNTIESIEHFQQSIKQFQEFYNFTPDTIVCDKHPHYESVKWAKEYAQTHQDIKLYQVQHHYAHALSTMAEYKLEKKVLAFCFDGTGYGDDGSLWGGEVLVASSTSFKRVTHLKQFSLLGGEKAIKEPSRVAFSLLCDIYSKEELIKLEHPFLKRYTTQEIQTLFTMHSHSLNTPQCSSFGRLFDAVYALMGETKPLSYEGESGLAIESFASNIDTLEYYPFRIHRGIIEYEQILLNILQEKNKSLIAVRFLNTIAQIILKIAKRYKHLDVLLTGGVFQNITLLNKVTTLLNKENIRYYIQEQSALNDGSISLGQAYYAIHKGSK